MKVLHNSFLWKEKNNANLKRKIWDLKTATVKQNSLQCSVREARQENISMQISSVGYWSKGNNLYFPGRIKYFL